MVWFGAKLKNTTRTHKKNIMMNLFQKLECSILFKKNNNSRFDLSFEISINYLKNILKSSDLAF